MTHEAVLRPEYPAGNGDLPSIAGPGCAFDEGCGLSRADDEQVLRYAIDEDYVLLTFNADFSDLRLIPVGTHSGIIRLRLHEQTARELHPILRRVIGQIESKDLNGKLVTVKSHSIRIRGT